MRRVCFEDYALTRMRMRDITEQEVLEALEAPRSQHWFSTKHRRMNVRRRVSVSGKTLLVAYERRDDEVVVVNAMWD
jgi:hypothetical protein